MSRRRSHQPGLSGAAYRPRHARPEAPAPPSRKQRALAARRRRVRRRRIIVGTVSGVFLVAVAAVGWLYLNLQGNIETHDIDALLDGDRPTTEEADPNDPHAGQELNILVMGSDVRADGDSDAANVDGMRSDATMLVHIAADRSRVDAVSIPRDTLVDIPSCRLPDGTSTEPAPNTIFNSAFHVGAGPNEDLGSAAACTIRTVEELTGVYIDDFIVIDFDGFQGMVDSLDGIPMYVEQDIDDPRAHLELAQGCQILSGDEALGYARARYSFGNGSDIGRMDRQQELIGALMRDVLDRGILSDAPRLYNFADAVTESLDTGEDIGSLTTLGGLGYSMRGLDTEDITFMTMPWEPAGARVTPSADAELVWEALRNGDPISEALDDGETETDSTDDDSVEAGPGDEDETATDTDDSDAADSDGGNGVDASPGETEAGEGPDGKVTGAFSTDQIHTTMENLLEASQETEALSGDDIPVCTR